MIKKVDKEVILEFKEYKFRYLFCYLLCCFLIIIFSYSLSLIIPLFRTIQPNAFFIFYYVYYLFITILFIFLILIFAFIGINFMVKFWSSVKKYTIKAIEVNN